MPTQRFLQLTEVSEILNISAAQAYALVRSGELSAKELVEAAIVRIEALDPALNAVTHRTFDQASDA